MLPNRNQACEVSDLGTDHLLIVRRLKFINEPLDQHFYTKSVQGENKECPTLLYKPFHSLYDLNERHY